MRHQARLIIILFLFFLSFSTIANSPADLVAIEMKPQKTHSYFIFVLTKKVKGEIKYSPWNNKIEVALLNTQAHFKVDKMNFKNANVNSFYPISHPDEQQFIFEVKDKIKWSIRYLPGSSQETVRLRLDIEPRKEVKPMTIQEQKIVERAKKSFETHMQDLLKNNWQTKTIKNSNHAAGELKRNIFIIVIDPGHGGKDPGAIGKKGTQEKNIVLAISKLLAKKINQTKGMKAFLTRNDDRFISLRGRLKHARKQDADLFIAIHADAYFNLKAKGASVYAISKRGATSEAARWLALRDNYSELGNVDLNRLQDSSLALRSVLIDLAQTSAIRESVRLGSKLLDALDDVTVLHHPTVEQAPFVVLKAPDIPSVLVEVGFVSNQAEEKKLRTLTYQKKIAEAVYQGILRYQRGILQKA
ncbi:MAG: hypothetical protein A3F12_03820 [Gammaproteobacteria bacterium RIFCSPHIGHO2_12_FULL_38_14]|nr:MAG: hypothetical protein A3F12_03820 [Gammaproteobacteria bacterium RIFCSPHIGHO2_12_FULL_38_14]